MGSLYQIYDQSTQWTVEIQKDKLVAYHIQFSVRAIEGSYHAS